MASWPWIVALAVVGSCLTWFSMFLLIEFGQLVLAAAVIAVVPVTTEIANYVWFTPVINTPQQWLGGALLLGSVGALIWFQLGTSEDDPAFGEPA
jgi:drug/metabolite transporter (DMT)-like permease